MAISIDGLIAQLNPMVDFRMSLIKGPLHKGLSSLIPHFNSTLTPLTTQIAIMQGRPRGIDSTIIMDICIHRNRNEWSVSYHDLYFV